MARGRPATPLGTWGAIGTRQLESGRWVANTRLRLWNGNTVQVQARANSKTAAANALKKKCAERLTTTDTDDLRTGSTIKALLDAWLETKQDLRPQSRDRYQNVADNHITPDFGSMRINEITPAFLDRYLQSKTPGIAHNISTVLKGAFKMATRYGLVAANPMDAVRPVQSNEREVRALDRSEIQPFREQIKKSGDQTLIDVTDLCLATGLRAGEALGLRWQDVDLENTPATITVTGTVVYAKGKGNRRQELTKTATSVRTIQLPPVARDMIKRRAEQYAEVLEMVFPSEAGSWIWQSTFNARLRKARGDQFDCVTVHTLRKTLASLIADELGPHKAADVLGHADSRLTERVYYERNRRGVAIGDVVDQAVPATLNQTPTATAG